MGRASRLRHFADHFALLSVVGLMALTANAATNDEACSVLFSGAVALEARATTLFAFDLSHLNEPSREYVTRIKYLVLERRLLGAETLQTISASPRPVNPLGDRAKALALHPHQAAFADLMNQDLQWELIREAINALAGTSNDVKKREQQAIAETRTVIVPVEVKKFPFTVKKIVRAKDGHLYGLNPQANRGDLNVTIQTYDLESAQLIWSPTSTYTAYADEVEAAPIGDTFVASIPEWGFQRILSFDLLGHKDLPAANIKTTGASPSGTSKALASTLHKAHFVETTQGPRVVTFVDHEAHLIDPMHGIEVGKVAFRSPGRFEVEHSGVVGKSVFAATSKSQSYLIDPTGQNPVQSTEKIMAIGAFLHQGKTYGVGVDLKGSRAGTLKIMKVVDFESENESMPFEIDCDMDWPRLLQTFESNNTVYGVLATGKDVYVVDLLKGRIEQTLSATPQGDTINAHWVQSAAGNVGFTHQGKSYLLGLLSNSHLNVKGDLIVLDALTLLPVSLGLHFDQPFAAVRRVPTEDQNQIQFIVSLLDGTSRLISLLSEI